MRARPRLDVGRKALLGPGVVAREVGEREVEHLVGEDPVAPQVGDLRLAADVDANSRCAAAERHAVPDPATAPRADVQAHVRDRITSEIGRHTRGGVLDPPDDRVLGHGKRARHCRFHRRGPDLETTLRRREGVGDGHGRQRRDRARKRRPEAVRQIGAQRKARIAK
jgi:hypothetical protein